MSLSGFCQSNASIPSVDSLEQMVLANDFNQSVTIINENLKKDLTTAQVNLLKAYKLKPLLEANLPDEAYALSLELLAETSLDINLRVDVLLNRAIIYEINDEFKKAKADLDTLEMLFQREPSLKDEAYGEYLYRKASLYRVNRLPDSALIFAKKSVAFTEANNYKATAGVAYLVMGLLYLKKDYDLSKYYYDKSLKSYQKVKNKSGIAMMYSNLTHLELRRGNTVTALRYNDSMMEVSKKTTRSLPLYVVHKDRALIFEELGYVDSAYANYKKYFEFYNTHENNNRNLLFQELEFQFELNKEKLAKDKIVEDNLKVKNDNKRLTYFALILICILIITAVLYNKLNAKNKIVKEKTREKDLLLKELHHRVKNNLMLILSLVEFQKEDFKDDYHKFKLTDLQHRIEAIAFVHQQMMVNTGNELDDRHNIKEYVNQIAQSLFQLSPHPIDYDSSIEELYVPLDIAVPLGILINELLSNTLKHAQPIGTLKISLHLYKENDLIIIDYKDNGINVESNKHKGLGTFIIESMVKQLKGRITDDKYAYHIQINPQTHS